MTALDRVLIAGYGSIGRRHARVIKGLHPRCRIAALRRADTLPDDGHVDEVVTSLDAALAFAPQAAVVANPASLHLETATALAAAGVHLLVEKPLAPTPDGVDQLIETCANAGVTLAVGYNLRFDVALQGVREAVHGGGVGRVLSVRAEVGQYLPDWRPDSDYRDSVSARAALGGGVLLELSHEIDYLRWLFGEARWVEAVLSTTSDLEIDVEDTAHLTLGFDGDAGRELVARVDLDFVRRDATRRCTVIGETGTLRWDALAGSVSRYDPEAGGWERVSAERPERDATYRAQWQHFTRCVAGAAMPLVGGADGKAVLEVVAAARRAAAAHRREPV